MDFIDVRDDYWKYYISLEKQFIETRRFVEFDYINNGKAYSIEFLKLFQAVCSEIDVIGKTLAVVLDPSFKPNKHTGINEWWYYVLSSDPLIESAKCNMFGERIIEPWKKFRIIRNPKPKAKKFILDDTNTPKAKTPFWWNDYNSVKHDRTGHYQKNATNYAKANLRNLFYAFAALFTLETKLMEKMFTDKDDTVSSEMESKLFTNEVSFYTTLLSISK